MIEYTYTAKDPQTDKVVKGKISADSQMAAASILTDKELYPIKIVPSGSENILQSALAFDKVKPKNRVIFTRQLATLVKAGLPITQALHTATEQVSDKNFKAKLVKVASSVEGGQTLSGSFAAYPEIFNQVYVSLVHAGEESGTLDDALERLASQQEKDLQIVTKVRGALIYPLLVLVVILGVLAYMLVTVMPQIQNLYFELKKPLPIVTQITLSVSRFGTVYWPLTLLAIAAVVLGSRAYVRTPHGRRVWDRAKLNMPVFGILFRKVYMARFTRTLGSLVTSGVPLLEALHISGQAINNVVLQTGVTRASDDVKSGKPLSSSIARDKNFLSLVPQMIKVGEESGTLGTMLDKVAEFYEEEVDQAVKNLSTIIEPILMIILGGMVFFIIIAILYPVYSLVGGGINLGNGGS